MVDLKYKRQYGSEVIQLSTNEIKRQRTHLHSDFDSTLKNLDNIFSGANKDEMRSRLRKINLHLKRDPSIADRLIHALSKRLISFPGQVLSEVWWLIRTCFNSAKTIPEDVRKPFLESASEDMGNMDPAIRRVILTFIGEQMDIRDSHDHIVHMLDDHDERIRLSASTALHTLATRGANLELPLYSKSLKMISDVSAQVRLMAFRILGVFAEQSKESMIHARDNDACEKIRVVDDAFAHLCDSLNDPDFHVRAEGAELLGKFNGVSVPFLLQTLEKNLMTNLNKIKSLNERAKGEGTEFSSGRKFEADKAVRGEVEDDNNVIARGACGAFIHGLEDEFRQVRIAALDSLCKLAVKETSGDFAKLSMDYMVDMLNDEIEEVRLNAVNNCCKLAAQVPVLLEDQLENVLTSCLPDSRQDIRISTHKLLASCKLLSKKCLNRTVEELLKSLLKFPDDQDSTYEAFRDLGKHHPHFCAALTPTLLGIHPFFDTCEIDISDTAYAAKLVLILNAAADSKSLANFFPPFVKRHYAYLRDVYPELVPKLDFLDVKDTKKHLEIKKSPTEEFVLHRVKSLPKINTNQSLKSALESLNRLKRTCSDREQMSVVLGHVEFLEVQDILRNYSFSRTNLNPIHHCMNLINRLLELFKGFSPEEEFHIKEFKLIAFAILCFFNEDESSGFTSSRFQRMIEEVTWCIKSGGFLPGKFTNSVIDQCRGIKRDSLLKTFLNSLLSDSSFSPRVRIISTAKLAEVFGTIDSPKNHQQMSWIVTLGHRFTAKATVCSPCCPLKKLAIRVRYGIGEDFMFFIGKEHLKELPKNRYEINRTVDLNNRVVWPTEMRVSLELCWLFEQDAFIEESEINPARGILLIDKISLDCTANNAPGTHTLV